MKTILCLGVFALLVACDGLVQPVCACSPPGGGTAVITGTVVDAAALPVVGAPVRLRVLHGDTCTLPDSTLTYTVETGADGRFRHSTSWAGGRKCFGLHAEPPAGSAASASEMQAVRIDFLDTVVPDSVELLLTLR
jgi:hypothetical protein